MRRTKIRSISFWCILFPLIFVYIICSAFRVYLWYEIVIYNCKMGRALRQGYDERECVGVHSMFTFLTFCEKWKCMIVFSFLLYFLWRKKGGKLGIGEAASFVYVEGVVYGECAPLDCPSRLECGDGCRVVGDISNFQYRFSAFWLRSKCSICSYRLNLRYTLYWE